VTNYTYKDTASPPYKTATTNGHWVQTVMDGFGRTIQTSTGSSATLSIVDVQYAPCGCSPLGKLSQQSQPYAPGGSDAWTVYHYDASGRTTSVVLPDGSTTSYQYQGNVVTVTDPAGKSKTFTMDALGNLVTVAESDPSLGNVTTTYTYDVLNHLTQVSMPRGTTTQTRTFNYTSSNLVGGFLLSATNPENGTVSYTYDALNRLASKTDAKGQQLTYAYDSYNRLTSVTWANSPSGAQLLRTYYYDTNPLDSTGTFSQYALGRLTAVQYPQFAPSVQMNDMYSYTQAGLPADKRLQVNQLVYYVDNNNHQQHQTVTVNLDSTYAYNNEGKLTAMTYPSTIGVGGTSVPGASYNYSYDSMYRLGGMTDSNNNTIVSGVSYNAANQLLGMTYNGIGETRAYNLLNQLTSIVAGSSENLTYNYPTGANNGKASSMYNALSGETVTYAYDSLNRMATAAGSGWGEAYTFDGFGNLTTKQVTSGSGPSLSVSVNPANNQLEGYGFNYDANGNALFDYTNNVTAYDVENHISGVGYNNGAPAVDYCYDAQNHRFFMWTAGTVDGYGNATSYSVVAYSPSGQKLGTYLFAPQQPSYQHGPYTPYMLVTLASSDQYFGGRRLAAMDQLGSAGTYYPWGEAKGGTNPQDTWSYATYWRDSATGLDYANNRYYNNAYGRFMTPDPYTASGGPADPQSWNRYSYVEGDPVNGIDPTGQFVQNPCALWGVESWACSPFNGMWQNPGTPGPSFAYYCAFDPGCMAQFAQQAPALPSCSQLTSQKGWTQTQMADFLTIYSDASRIGLNFIYFTVVGMHVAGQPPLAGVPTSQTELVMTGNQSALTALLSSMCTTSGYSGANPGCFAPAGFDPLHAGTPGNQINFRQNTATNSMQITGSQANGVWTLTVDIDPNNPMSGIWGALGHSANVISNFFEGNDTNYSSVANALGINPYQNNGICHQ
jgi:RHS repeat-associated protein